MMSQTSIMTLTLFPLSSTSTIFFVTFVPMVAMYLSSKTSSTNLLMRLVLPTPASPIKQTLTFMRSSSFIEVSSTHWSLKLNLQVNMLNSF